MQTLLFRLIYLCPVISFAQISYDFDQALPPQLEEVITTDERWFGDYGAEEDDRTYTISANGIWVYNNEIQGMSRQTLRESTRYSLRNGYLFGVHATDSLPVIEEGEMIYFGVRTSEQITGGRSPHKLKKLSANTYILSFYENGTFVPCLISIVAGEMRWQYFDYESDTNAFDGLQKARSQERQGIIIHTLSPSAAEFADLDFKAIFGEEAIFRKK